MQIDAIKAVSNSLDFSLFSNKVNLKREGASTQLVPQALKIRWHSIHCILVEY